MVNNDKVKEWEEGLPSPADLTPLSQCLISPELASAFCIAADEPTYRTLADVNRASQATFAGLRRAASISFPVEIGQTPPAAPTVQRVAATGEDPQQSQQAKLVAPTAFLPSAGLLLGSYGHDDGKGGFKATQGASEGSPGVGYPGGTDSSDGAARNVRADAEMETEEAESGGQGQEEDQAARTLKRPRLVWTPELHKRFVEAVAHLGIKNAVPKTIMQLMNVEGLTRENVASHLQKYRLYLKRMQGLSNEGPSASDQLFASTPVPPSLAASTRFFATHVDEGIPIPFTSPRVPVPLGRPHVAAHAPGPFAAMDPHAYNALARAQAPQRFAPGDQKDQHGNNPSQPASSSHRILRLFPTGSR